MSSSMQLYGITIVNLNNNAAPSDGFIDPTTTEIYYDTPVHNPSDGLEGVPAGASLSTTTAKRRGNLRFQHLLQCVQTIGNCYLNTDPLPNFVFNNNATATSEGSSYSFQLLAEHGPDSLQTLDETTPGVILMGTAALIRALARGLSSPYVTATYVFDPTPTTSTGLGQNVSIPRFGDRIGGPGSFIVGPYATSLASAQNCITVIALLPVAPVPASMPTAIWLNAH